jgi:RimJ/RimL family protein N-acetyltransferase
MSRANLGAVEVVEPFPRWAWPRIWTWMQEFRSRVCDDFGPQSLEEFLQLQATQEPMRRDFGVWRDGVLGGYVCVLRAHPKMPSAQMHIIFRKSFFGRETVVPVLRCACAKLFAEDGVLTIRSEVFADNAAIREFVREVGFREYGLRAPAWKREMAVRNGRRPREVDPIPNITLRDGEPVDVVGLALTAEDFDHANWIGSGAPAGWAVSRGLDRVGRPGAAQNDLDDDAAADAAADATQPAALGSARPQPGEPDREDGGDPPESPAGEGQHQPSDG